MEAQTRPTFLTIPPELGLEIYRHLLISQRPISLNTSQIPRPSNRVDTAILRTCRSINNEAESVLAKNTFVIKIKKLPSAGYRAPPRILAPTILMGREGLLRPPPAFKRFIIRVDIVENVFVKAIHWERLTDKVVDAMILLPCIKFLRIEVGYVSRDRDRDILVPSAASEIPFRTIPAEVAAKLVGSFGRLQGVAHTEAGWIWKAPMRKSILRWGAHSL